MKRVINNFISNQQSLKRISSFKNSLSINRLSSNNYKSNFKNESFNSSSSTSTSTSINNNSKILFTTGLGLFGLLTTITYLEEEKKKEINSLNEIRSRIPEEAIKEFVLLFQDRFVTNIQDRDAHGKDFSYHERQNPDAIFYPLNEEEVIKFVEICKRFKIPIIPYGSGTSLEGHTIATNGGISIDFRNMRKILQICGDDLYCIVQPGISYGDLNEELKKQGYFFPVDPGPGASIGGMVGTSCSGTHAVRYGTMKDNVLSLRVILPNTNLVNTRSKAKKSSAGYDLTHLFIGSEGTLGITTEATLKIVPLPESTRVSMVTFDDIQSASNTVIKTIQSGVHIGRVELMDEVMMKAVNMASGSSFSEKPTLLFEFEGSEAVVQEQIEKVELISKNFNALEFKFSKTDEEKDGLWLARKIALWSSKVLRPTSEVWITDACVPISELSNVIEATKKDIKKTSLLAPLVAHAGDGNFHLFILFDPTKPNEVKEAKFINHNLVDRSIKVNGTCTGEHGVSFGKIKYLDQELGHEAVHLMKTIKKAIDPDNIMNPGKIITVEEFQKDN
ncbi:hypothetical protein CYY_009389 [Polysphondylium violaceum]|uniref:D-lactate dehydrogenase (cytochrome) n=1 Tax=Polysphondylium violaceum TaxID=133409 RepID=A0A8J4PMW9_9MYCE|nr:hypothetical protein CYY_009389 [Polysphondylium violaceum]